MRNTLILAASFLTLVAFQTPSFADAFRPCGKAVKFCHYNPWEEGIQGDRDGGGSVAQTGGRTKNSSKY